MGQPFSSLFVTTSSNLPKSARKPPLYASFLEKHGKQRFGINFHIYPEDHTTIHKLLIYFLRHEKDASRLDIDLDKGVFLAGPASYGKNCLMVLMTYISVPERNFVLRSCRDIRF
jgi:hypothetical protein